MRIKFPPNFLMPPHTHPYSEVVTVISGPIGPNSGEKVDRTGDLLEPGSMWVYPAKRQLITRGPAMRRASSKSKFTGPGGIDYINPADDPRKQAAR